MSLELAFAASKQSLKITQQKNSSKLCLTIEDGAIWLYLDDGVGGRLEGTNAKMRLDAKRGCGIFVLTTDLPDPTSSETLVLGFYYDYEATNQVLEIIHEKCVLLSEVAFSHYISMFQSFEVTGIQPTRELFEEIEQLEFSKDSRTSEIVCLSDSDCDDADSEKVDVGFGISDKKVLIYPSSGINAVTLYEHDLTRLADGEFLNDSLIEFQLRFLLHGTPKSNRNHQFHFFNTFFYSQLTAVDQNKRKIPFNECYQRVRKWTSKFNLFMKRFLVIPINENLHWYLAVIINPWAFLAALDSDLQYDTNAVQATVFIFDSLNGQHPCVQDTLSDYLKMEALDKLGRVVPTPVKLHLVHAKVQNQLNNCDCGLFLLHHAKLIVEKTDAVIQAMLNDQRLDTPEFGTLEEIRRTRIELKERINILR
ncbi:hypothetical protein BDR26DRAFT_933573 [Obelidium mucronatum]|nr:hypothetical protein BDR26DRAFT_933573 [Obelidium mucronatum]